MAIAVVFHISDSFIMLLYNVIGNPFVNQES